MTHDLFNLPTNQMHRPGQSTSRRALEKTTESRGNRTKAVFDFLKGYGARGAIPEELAAAMGEELIDVRRCFSVLKKLEKIEPTGEERLNNKQNYCEVWRVMTRPKAMNESYEDYNHE